MSHQHSRHRETIRALKLDPAVVGALGSRIPAERHRGAFDAAIGAVEAFGQLGGRFDLDAYLSEMERAA